MREYPNKQSKERYINVIACEYQTKYSRFSEKEIKAAVQIAIDCVDAVINEFDYDALKLLAIKDLRDIVVGNVSDEKKKRIDCDSKVIIFHFCNKVEAGVREDLEFYQKSQMPERHKDEYMSFVSQMTKRVFDDISKATIGHINNAKKARRFSKKAAKKDTRVIETRSIVKQIMKTKGCSSLQSKKKVSFSVTI